MLAQVLAVTFASPWIAAAGGALATAPIILHLLNRRRYRRVPWAAMRFLLESRRRNRRRLLLEDIILLALRCLVIGLIAMAVARPLGDAGGFGRGPTDHWLVIDDSASMGATLGSTDTFAAARADLIDLIGRVGPDDRWGVYRTSDRGEPWLVMDRYEDRETLIGRIGALRSGDTRGGLPETLGAIARGLGESDNAAKVVILSDWRRVDVAGDAGKLVAAELRRLDAAAATLLLIDHGRPVANNLTIETIACLDRHVIAALPTRLAVTVANHGTAASASGRLALAIDDIELPVLNLPAIGAGSRRTVEVRCVFPEAAPSVVRAQSPPDALAADSTRWRVFEPRKALSVLIVDGERGVNSTARTDAFYLSMALDPRGDGSDGVGPETIAPAAMANVDLDRYDLIVMAGVARFPEQLDDDGRLTYPLVAELDRYVRSGGGLVVFTGDRVDLNFYNDVLYDGGRGLLPLPIAPAVGDARAREQSVKIRGDSIADTPWLTKAFGGDMAVLASLINFYRYTPAAAPSAGADDDGDPPHILARFDDERASPAIVQRRCGDGSVVMIYTSVGGRWHDWASSTNMTYLPVMNDMVAHLSRPRSAADCNGPVDLPMVYSLDDVAVGAAAGLRTPAFPRVDLQTLTVGLVDRQLQVTYDRPRWAGVYELTYTGLSGRDHRRLIARAVEPIEGDMAKAAGAEVRAIAPTDATYLDRAAGAEAAVTDADRPEYWRWVLVAAMIALALEVWLGQRFGHYTG